MGNEINFTCTMSIIHAINGAESNIDLDQKALRVWAHTSYDELSFAETAISDRNLIIDEQRKSIASANEEIHALELSIEDMKSRNERLLSSLNREQSKLKQWENALTDAIKPLRKILQFTIDGYMTHAQKNGALSILLGIIDEIDRQFGRRNTPEETNDIPF